MEEKTIRPKGVGKDAKRHDLDAVRSPAGTPGLSNSSLQYGDVSKLERGQQLIENTQPRQTSAPVAPAPVDPGVQGVEVAPDPVSFAKQKLAGSAAEGFADRRLRTTDRKGWLPFMKRLASDPTASGILQRAYIERIGRELRTPTGGQAQVLRQRDMDSRLREFNER